MAILDLSGQTGADPQHSLGHYAAGGVKYVVAQFLDETPQSRARYEICTGIRKDDFGNETQVKKGCDYYSETTRNAYTGKKMCRLCKCPVLEKSKTPSEKCPMELWQS